MREIVVVSGKGGTGKTSISASLAVLAGSVVVADCDVDAADMYMLLQPEETVKSVFRSGSEAVLDSTRCICCGRCLELCRFGAISMSGDHRYSIDAAGCEGCGVCARFCPPGAISMRERDCGVWMSSLARTGPLVHARLNPAAENSGKLVSLVRCEARRIAEEKGIDTVICDGPPGIGCPVIASVTGASLVLAVTEPTLSALHDVERVLCLASHFSIPSAVCINRYDINPGLSDEIEKRAAEIGAHSAGRVRYDPGFTKALVAGRTIVETDSPAAGDLRKLWRRLNEIGEGSDG